MTDQNRENLLNLALDSTNTEREKSQNLNVGYNPSSDEWEVIIKYSGSIEDVSEIVNRMTILRNGYAILTLKEEDIFRLSEFSQIEYIEKPKRLYFGVENGRRVSCINSVQNTRLFVNGEGSVPLFGTGVLVAILDSGINYQLPDFRNMDGTTRIERLWDQTIEGNPPKGYQVGAEYTREQINASLLNEDGVILSRDYSGHGTAVAGVAAGNGRSSDGEYRGVASESDLLVVKLGTPRSGGFPRTTELMQALNYVIDVAATMQKPVAVNISIGNNYGSHDGTSLLERFIDELSAVGRTVICVGSGNEGVGASHTYGKVIQGDREVIEVAVQRLETVLSVQLWKSYVDEIEINIESPSGEQIGPITDRLGSQRYELDGVNLLLYYGKPSPYSVRQEIYFDFLPKETYITSGVWKIYLTGRRIVDGKYEMWLPSSSVLAVGTGFLNPNPTLTLTIPSTASRVITVGAYDAREFTYANFSGRGGNNAKPDLVAPGVDVITVSANGGYQSVSGTSFATPFVTGSAALLMEWGIVNGNDSFLYGEKVKAYLQKGARALPGFTKYPNPEIGYGALCVRDSIP